MNMNKIYISLQSVVIYTLNNKQETFKYLLMPLYFRISYHKAQTHVNCFIN